MTDAERGQLQLWANGRKTAQALALRARLILECADGVENNKVALKLTVSNQTVCKWRARFLQLRLDGLLDAPRSGAPRAIDDAHVATLIARTMENPPPDTTSWSTRSMAREVHLSQSTVSRIWRTFGVQPRRHSVVSALTPSLCADQVRGIVGVYIDPPFKAVLLCVAASLSSRAPDISPLHLVSAHAMDSETAAQFDKPASASAAHVAHPGRRPKVREFLRFLNRVMDTRDENATLHLLIDDNHIHQSPSIRHRLARRPHFQVHHAPNSAFWLHQVEHWFSTLKERQHRQTGNSSIHALDSAIQEFINDKASQAAPFIWIADPAPASQWARHVVSGTP